MNSQSSERYTHGHGAAVVEQHAKRTAEEAASFLLSELRPGLRLLDIGCGPGSITVGLARRVALGIAVGVDSSPSIVGMAAREVVSEDSPNIRFHLGDLYNLPYAAATFDVAYAHQVLQHLNRPAEALTEARRVLRPNGVIACREVDWGTSAVWPPNTAMDSFLALYRDVSRRNGGDPCVGRRIRSLLLDAGFQRTRITAGTWCFADPIGTRSWGESWARRLTESFIGERALEYGLESMEGLQKLADGLREWGEHPDAYFSFIHTEALGWPNRPA